MLSLLSLDELVAEKERVRNLTAEIERTVQEFDLLAQDLNGA